MYQKFYHYISSITLLTFLSFILISLFGVCESKAENYKVIDSIVVREKTLYLKDTLQNTIPARIIEHTIAKRESHLETDYAISDARINKDGSLFHSLKHKPSKKPILRPIHVVVRDTIIYHENNEIIIKEVPTEFSWFQKTQMYGFWCLLIIILITPTIILIIKKKR